MKTFVALVLLGIVATAVAASRRNKRWVFPKPEKCSSEADCGADRCCVGVGSLKYCAPKRGHNQSCNLVNLHGCGCKDGLSCQVHWEWLGIKYYRCLPEPGSGDGF